MNFGVTFSQPPGEDLKGEILFATALLKDDVQVRRFCPPARGEFKAQASFWRVREIRTDADLHSCCLAVGERKDLITGIERDGERRDNAKLSPLWSPIGQPHVSG